MPHPVTAVALALLLVVLGRQEPEPTRQPPASLVRRVLVTNDDGIDSPALAQLVAALAARGHEVVVCAPNGDRSGSSQSVASWREGMTVREASVEGARLAFAVGGSPADAVCYGVLHLGTERPFDLVVSGINDGANVGELSHYSGTVGAAMEAAYRGLPAIAVSQGSRSRDFGFTADFTARFADELLRRGSRPGLVHSINVPGPKAKDADVVPRAMGGSYLVVTGWSEAEASDEEGRARPKLGYRAAAPEGSDTAAFLGGKVTITPLQFDWTDRAALADLATWDLE
ncbi:MAG: 5'/3'-nucleotidase SurE [Planctomycetota bacterium]|nr:5'/3'-nucleotidase SurE [Planctomycetota bacterium]